VTRRDAIRLPGWLALVALEGRARAADERADGYLVRVRMGASSSLVGAEYNPNDTRAALVVWADTFSRGTGVKIEYLPEVITPPAQLYERVRLAQVDAFSCTTREYLQVAPYTDPNSLMVDKSYGDGGEEYLILVHADSGFRTLADLRGSRLSVFGGIVMSLASDWLETALAASNLGSSETFFKQTSANAKASRAVLPVFFRQTDACLVNRRTFDTMAEMNPQLAVKLRIVATSPRLVPVVVVFHKNCTPLQKEKFKLALASMGATPGGQQILNLFGSAGLRDATPAILAASIAIITAVGRLKGPHAAARH
jgi:ABC-type phosphate/phosphonate transport system substrate-binding protein